MGVVFGLWPNPLSHRLDAASTILLATTAGLSLTLHSVADMTSLPNPSIRRSRRLRIAGVLVLLLGISGAGLVYWLGTRSPDMMDDPSMAGFNNAQRRQMGQLYGEMGLMIDQFSDDLKQPGTQAGIIVVVSVLVASGCFHFARLTVHRDEISDGSGSHPGG